MRPMDARTHDASHATNDIDWYDIVFHCMQLDILGSEKSKEEQVR